MSTDPLLFRIALSGDTMGTRYSALFFAPQAEGHAECAARLHDAVSDVDAVMSNWKPDSSISRLNRTKPGDWLELPESLLDVLETALAIERATKGAFDIGVADAVAHWGFGPDAGRRPAPEQGAQPRTCENLEIDRANHRVRKHAPIALDLSGIAKGYGVDRLGETLSAAGVKDWLVGIDGDMRGRGCKADGLPWVIGLEKPLQGHRQIGGVLELSDLAVATSGTYRHYRDIDGKTISHTIDPMTGHPVDGKLASVTVLARTCMEADAWATAILVDGRWPPKRFHAPEEIDAIVASV